MSSFNFMMKVVVKVLEDDGNIYSIFECPHNFVMDGREICFAFNEATTSIKGDICEITYSSLESTAFDAALITPEMLSSVSKINDIYIDDIINTSTGLGKSDLFYPIELLEITFILDDGSTIAVDRSVIEEFDFNKYLEMTTSFYQQFVDLHPGSIEHYGLSSD